MLRRVHDPERGASLLEHTAVLVLVAALVGGVALAIPTSTVTTAVEDAVERVLGEEGAGTDLAEGTPSDGAAEPTTPGQDGPEPGGQEEGADSPATDEPSAGEDPPVGGVGEQAAPPGDDRGFWDHAGEFFTDGAWGGVVDDATEMWDSVTDPVGAVVDAWNGFTTYFGEAHQRAQDSGQQARQQWAEGDYFGAAWTLVSDTAQESLWEAPWSAGGLVRSIADENVVEAWQNGDYGEALGRGVWNAGQWFIPYAGWANRINNMLPDAPSPGRGDNGVPTQQRADDDDPNVAAACPRGSSFLPGTPVLLADGTYTPIETIDVGDEVWAFDPLTGEEGPRQVTDLITSTGEKTLVQLTLTDPSGATDTLTATDNHPFWAPEHAQWVQAIDLQPGTWLRTSTGTWTQVTAIEAWTAPHQRVHNLTVTGIHTYYVGTAAGDALVHNQDRCDAPEPPPEENRPATELRNSPGTAEGGESLPTVTDNWRRGTENNAAITPQQVADQLRGREFQDFNEFRRAYWQAVASTPELASQFSPNQVTRMNNGLAPFVPQSQQVPGQQTYQLHHQTPINQGGSVYDLDNIIVVTPRYHQEVLDPGYHYGRG